MKKILYLTVAIASNMVSASMPGHSTNPFEHHPAMFQDDSPFHAPMTEDSHPFAAVNPFEDHHSLQKEYPAHQLAEKNNVQHTLESFNQQEHREPTMTEEDHSDSIESTLPATASTEAESLHKEPATRISTASHNTAVSTLHITAGHTHTFAPLISESTNVTGYFIQDPQYSHYLTSTETSMGEKTTVTYTLTIPSDAPSGSCTIFEGHGSLTAPQHLTPAFHVEIQSASDDMTSQNPIDFKEQVKAAWQQQEDAEQKYFADLKTRFETFRTEVRTIWSNVTTKDTPQETHSSGKMVTKEPLTIHIGETKKVASSKGGSIQSSNPLAVSVKLSFVKKGKPSWDFILTANEIGKSVISYTIDGISYVQPVIVQSELTGKSTDNFSESRDAESTDQDSMSSAEDMAAAEISGNLPTPLASAIEEHTLPDIDITKPESATEPQSSLEKEIPKEANIPSDEEKTKLDTESAKELIEDHEVTEETPADEMTHENESLPHESKEKEWV